MRYLRKAAKIQAMPQPKQAIVTTQLVSGDLKFPTARVNKSNPAAIITNRLKILIIPKKMPTAAPATIIRATENFQDGLKFP